jgi:hypothetical protein
MKLSSLMVWFLKFFSAWKIIISVLFLSVDNFNILDRFCNSTWSLDLF